MSNDINLLSRSRKTRFSQEQILVYTKVLAVICSIVTVSMAVILFLLNRDPALTQIQAQQQTILTQLNILHNKTAKDLIILDRVRRIAKINKNRSTLGDKITEVQKQIPFGVSITAFTLDSQHLVMTVSAQSLSPIGAFIENLSKDVENKDLLKKITIQGVITDEKNGSYLLSVTGDLL